jgi:hypothetical protein
VATTSMSNSPAPLSGSPIVVGGASVTGPSSGGFRTSVTRGSETTMRLQVRNRNGAPRQRSASTHILTAMKVSMSQLSATPSTTR